MAESPKQTIYIDIDDEITSIIDKVKSSSGKIIALVLPKRATVLQSIVNMKLLKKSAQSHKKSLVLITSEAGLLPLAGVVGLHVAKTLQSKPVIPPPPDQAESEETEVSDTDAEDEPEIDKSTPIGVLANKNDGSREDDTETIELDDEVTDAPAVAGAKLRRSKLAKRFRVPNFDKFRLSFFLGIAGVILLIIGWLLAFVVMPKAVVTISTDTSTISVALSFTADTKLKTLDVDKKLVPASIEELKKTDTERVAATGKKDKGKKAGGNVELSIPCADVSGSPPEIPAGTRISSDGLVFITDGSINLTEPDFPPCKFYGTGTATAESGGTQYNLSSGKTFSVSGYPSVTGTNTGDMTGGTTKIVNVVTQDDIDAAADKMKGSEDEKAFEELEELLREEGLQPIDQTRVTGKPVIKSKPAVNEEATGDITVTATTTYSVIGVKNEDLSQLIKKEAASKIDESRQSIVDDGQKDAVMRLEARKSPSKAQLNLQSLVQIGPDIDENSVRDQIKGQKRGDAERIISQLPGVKDVTIEYKPFWVLSTPKAAKKITIIIEKPIVNLEATHEEGNE